MATCAWSEKKKSCGLMTQEDSIYCPRHTFLHNIAQKEAADKEIAKAEEAKLKRPETGPKTQRDLEAQGYRFAGSSACDGCKQHIQWWLTPNGKRAPYNSMTEPDSPAVSHFATCVKARDFRRAG